MNNKAIIEFGFRRMWSLLLVLFLAPRGFSPGTPVFPSLKNQHFQIQFNPGMYGHSWNEFLWSPWCSVGKQITFTFYFFPPSTKPRSPNSNWNRIEEPRENQLWLMFLPPFSNCCNSYQYHPTSGLMQILHFDWLRYYGTISNSHRVAKFAGFSFFFPQINISLTCIC